MATTTETETATYSLRAVRHAGWEDGRDAAPYDPPQWAARIYAEGYERGFRAYLADR